MAENNTIDYFIEKYTTFNERKTALVALIGKAAGGTVLSSELKGTQISERIVYLSQIFSEIKQDINAISPALITRTNDLLDQINNEITYILVNINEPSVITFIVKLSTYIGEAQSIRITSLNNNRSQEFEKLLTKYEETIQKLEINTNSLDFKDTVLQYDSKAKKWLKNIMILSAILFIVIIIFMCLTWFDGKLFMEYKKATINFTEADKYFNVILYFEILKKSILRILIITLIIYFIKFSISNYNAYMHNRTLNQHKANTLDASIRILNLTKPDDEVRNSILGLASKEIFSHHNTGYLGKEEKIDFSIIEKLLSLGKKSE